MIEPLPNQELPKSIGSRVKIRFRCECKNIFTTSWRDFVNKKTQSCGKCKLYKWKSSKQIKFSSLTLIEDLQSIRRLTDSVLWKCDCGNFKKIKPCFVIKGNTKSCGCIRHTSIKHAISTKKRHEILEKFEWLQKFPSLIDKDLPNKWSRMTGKTFTFICKCEKLYEQKFSRYDPNTSTCKRCTETQLQTGQMINTWKYEGPEIKINSNSNKCIKFICKCGKSCIAPIRDVFSGYKKTCNQCELISSKDISNRIFGKLTIVNPVNLYPYSEKEVQWKCTCGNTTTIKSNNVLLGYTSSCGQCKKKADEWYINNKEQIKNLKCPIKSGKILKGIEALEDIQNVSTPFNALCMICGNQYKPRLHGIKNGESLTCGCTSGRISQHQREICLFIKKLGFTSILEYEVKGALYDIFVPAKNLLIEYQGLKWHSSLEARKRDLNKASLAKSEGYDFLSIFEDEWRYKQNAFKALIKNKLNINKPISLRPSKCILVKPSINEANELYEAYHYIGSCKSNIHYGMTWKDELIACVSFSNPTRQSTHKWELIRMVSDPRYRIHGVWSKLLKEFMKEHNPKSIISFSDNRIFQGQTYGKIGFEFDGDVLPNYYWTKNKKRYNKSGLRKPKGFEGTETDLRTSQGYEKIWDIGKKRWLLKNNDYQTQSLFIPWNNQ